MHKTTIRLSDGRQLSYYDAAPGQHRDAADRRDLPPANSASQLRYEPFLDTWVIYASHRQDRSYLPSAQDCPLCPSADHLTEIPAADYEVVVFDNRFPALSAAPPGAGPAGPEGPGAGWPAGVLPERPAAGRCEVVCYTSDHDASFAELPRERVELVLQALIDRTAELSALAGVDQVFCFENRGREIGVTQPHPHGQIYAYPFVTPRTEKALASARAYYRRTARNLFDDVVAAELADGTRVVSQTEHWAAFVPHAARWPYEIHLYPRRRVPDLASLGPAELCDLAGIELDIFGRFARLFDQPAPYIAGWHQAPVRAGRDLFALHLELFTSRRASDKLKYLAGSESAMDAFASDVMPEAAAARLREVDA
ncbi:MAG TPA: galactose-1-phosphate uridylyltransferase [Streptosporangiaceae bacterium]|nr:galactose-1-phosphate uridylyltransferase [Streptosporangiaceae bacterium]